MDADMIDFICVYLRPSAVDIHDDSRVEVILSSFDLQLWTRIGAMNRARFLGARASRRRVPVFSSRLAGGTPALPGGSWAELF
jgi:hypothetical protein